MFLVKGIISLVKMIKHLNKNKKVINAINCVFNGIRFKSKLEMYFYKICVEHKIKVTLQPKFLLQPKYEYLDLKIREITHSPDFFLEDYNTLVETKGFKTDSYVLKRKMLLYHLFISGKNPEYVILKNQKECLEYIKRLSPLNDCPQFNRR